MDPNQFNCNSFLNYLQNSNFLQNPNIQNSQSSNLQNLNLNLNPNFQIPNFFVNPNLQNSNAQVPFFLNNQNPQIFQFSYPTVFNSLARSTGTSSFPFQIKFGCLGIRSISVEGSSDPSPKMPKDLTLGLQYSQFSSHNGLDAIDLNNEQNEYGGQDSGHW